MIVCADRPLAFRVLKEIILVRPDWGIARKAEDDESLSEEQLDKLLPLPKLTLLQREDRMMQKNYTICAVQRNIVRSWTSSSKTMIPISK